MSYGAEIWGQEERKELEKIVLDYVRWIYKLDFCTPKYDNKGIRYRETKDTLAYQGKKIRRKT